nr:hypothetical protein [uncultured Holophaga sp.]
MRRGEGRGFLIRAGWDTPWRGWVAARLLDTRAPLAEAPWMALRAAGELAQVFPGGLALLWDAPPEWLEALPPDTRSAFWGALASLPGLTLHFRDELPSGIPDARLQAWLHAPSPPSGASGRAWRQGWVGWCPDPLGETWRLPEIGTQATLPQRTLECLWGEIIVPLAALAHLESAEILPLVTETQGGLELALSQRLAAGAWPEAFPFHRRRTSWRLAVTGGREYLASGGSWEEAARRLSSLARDLAEGLRTPVLPGVCSDPFPSSILGHQSMREGHPWRSALPLPPSSPAFTPGLGADPREPSPLEARTLFPPALAGTLVHPPSVLLRVPSLPQEAAVETFLRGQQYLPAIHWLPPGAPPPGPFLADHPWTPCSAFTPLLDVTQALPQSLFEDWDPDV